MEVTTPEGHILALFDLNDSAQKLTDLLIQIGIPRTQHGKEEAISSAHAEDVIRRIHGAGGLTIAAHANEKGSGLLQVKGRYKMTIVPMPELSALEFTKRDDVERFSAGKVSPDYPPKACIQSSDSHSVDQIGRAVSYLKMHERNLNGIRQALLDYEVRVRCSWSYLESTHPRILQLSVNQGFFGGQNFLFHEGLNCLVGGKGTGKSTTIELLRYCFDDVPAFTHIREDHDGKIRSLVGDGGTITIVYADEDGDQKTIVREVQPWVTERQVTDRAGNSASILVPPAFFSQGELVEIARSPIAQLDLIDHRLDLRTDTADEVAVIAQLRANGAQLAASKVKNDALRVDIGHPEKGLAATKAQHAIHAKQLKDPILKEFPRWETEQGHLTGLEEALTLVQTAVQEALDAVDLDDVDSTLPDDAPNKTELKSLVTLEDEIRAALKRAKKLFDDDIGQLRVKLLAAKRKLAKPFAEKKAAHDRLLTGLKQADVRRATAHFRSLGARLDGLAKSERDLKASSQRLLDLQLARDGMIRKLAKIRAVRTAKRAAKASEYEKKLAGLIRVSVDGSGDRSHFGAAIRTLSHGARIKETEVTRIASALTPSELREYVTSGDIARLVSKTGVTQDVAKRLIEGCASKELRDILDLDCVDVPDLPRVEYRVAAARYRPLTELSTGQKGTVILELAMIEGAGPLVIDHPEEPLDTQSIYGQVVSALRLGKDTRQYIFTTHNANVAVGADAELSHVLGATADKGIIESSGGVDHQETNRLLLLHLEGGPDALRRRIKKYGM
jgi:hypothetical protein